MGASSSDSRAFPLDGDRAAARGRTLVAALDQLATEITAGRHGRPVRFLSAYVLQGGDKAPVHGGESRAASLAAEGLVAASAVDGAGAMSRKLTVFFEGRTPLAEFRRRVLGGRTVTR